MGKGRQDVPIASVEMMGKRSFCLSYVASCPLFVSLWFKFPMTLTIRHLFSKPEHRVPMQPQEHLDLTAGHGIQGDINANAHSPRQVLVVLAEDLQRFGLPPGELRENIVLQEGESNTGYAQLNQRFVPGTLLQFDRAAIRRTFYCEPCKLVEPFVAPIKRLECQRGILGVVVSDGILSVGEGVRLQANAYPPMSDVPYERFVALVRQVPAGKVITYRQILVGIGVSRSYFRVLPLYLRKAIATDCPIHRVLDSNGCLVSHIPNQQALLEAEGVRVQDNEASPSVSVSQYGWIGPSQSIP